MSDNKEALPVARWTGIVTNHPNGGFVAYGDYLTALLELRAEVEQWKAFAQHCQRSVGAIKSKMTAEQVIEFLGEETSAMIDRVASQDTSDIDPELLEFARETLAARSAASGESAEGGV